MTINIYKHRSDNEYYLDHVVNILAYIGHYDQRKVFVASEVLGVTMSRWKTFQQPALEAMIIAYK